MNAQQRPDCICANCFAAWRATRPKPPAVYCWHRGNAARLRAEGWQILEHISTSDLAELRAGGLL